MKDPVRSDPDRSGIPRADVVGSLLRPRAVSEARADRAAGRITAERLREIEDQAVRQLIELQRDCGFEVVTDGEVRRRIFFSPLSEGLDGIANIPGRLATWFDADGHEHRLPLPMTTVGPLRLRESIAVAEYDFARGVANLPVKVTLPGPMALLHAWTADHSAQAYPDPREMFSDCAAILAEIIRRLVDLGCDYVQFDAPELTNVVDPDAREELAGDLGLSDQELLAIGCGLMDQLAEPYAGRVRFSVHLCRGNNAGLHRRSGGYERLIRALYDLTPNVTTLMLEFDNDRSGGLDALAGAPAEKLLVLGLVSTKLGQLEDRGQLIDRIGEAARHVPLDQLALSTQCGFASISHAHTMTEAEQREKLSLVADVAAEVWN